MNGTRAICLCLVLSGSAGRLHAQMSVEGPFLGQVQEGFEGHQAGDYSECLGAPILGGLASACTPGTSGATVSTGETFVCSVAPYAGSQFLTSVDGSIEIRFHEPVQRFGARFATSSAISDATMTFYDWSHAPIGVPQVAVIPGDCGWVWQGWKADGIGIASVAIEGNSFNDGAFIQIDEIEVDTSPTIGRFCVGDGSLTGCPCGNLGLDGHGCANGTHASGARLSADGSSSLLADDLVFRVDAVPAMEPVILASSTQSPLGQTPLMIGDGLLCLRGQLQRIEVSFAGADGGCTFRSVASSQSGLGPGATLHYQAWYRDSVNSPCSGAANLSAGLSVLWVP